MTTRVDPITRNQAISIAAMTDREMRAAGFDPPDAYREMALELLADEVQRLTDAAKPQGSAWARLVAEADAKQETS